MVVGFSPTLSGARPLLGFSSQNICTVKRPKASATSIAALARLMFFAFIVKIPTHYRISNAVSWEGLGTIAKVVKFNSVAPENLVSNL
jgi:hypothetical protein